MSGSTEFYVKQLVELTGAEITGVTTSEADEFGDEIFGLALEMEDGRGCILWLLRDDAGNGPGSFSIDWDNMPQQERFAWATARRDLEEPQMQAAYEEKDG